MAVVNVHLETARKGLFAFLGDDPELLKAIGIKPMSSRRVLNAKGTADDRAVINAEIRDRESARAMTWSLQGNQLTPVIVAGDFNLPVESTIFRRHWGEFTDAFEAAGSGFGWTRQEGALLRIRIDHILGNATRRARSGHGSGRISGVIIGRVVADMLWDKRNTVRGY